MMKRLMCLLFAVSMLLGCAGLQQIQEQDRAFNQVYDAPGLSKDLIYEGAKVWIAENFRSAKAVIEYDNKEEGTLIGNGSIPYPCKALECIAKSDWKVPFTMRLDTKDDKFRLTFSNLRITWPSSFSSLTGATSGGNVPVSSQGQMNDIQPVLLNFGNELLESLTSAPQKSDW